MPHNCHGTDKISIEEIAIFSFFEKRGGGKGEEGVRKKKKGRDNKRENNKRDRKMGLPVSNAANIRSAI